MRDGGNLEAGTRPGDAELIAATQRRVRLGSISANVAGAAVVFVFLAVVLPVPPAVQHKTWLLEVNGGLLVVSLLAGVPLGNLLLTRLWRARNGWLVEHRAPTARERELTLRFPLTQHLVIAALWALDALCFGVVNLFFSAELGANVAMTIMLGGLVMVALGYLLVERLMRPIAALALSSGVPARPQLPGVAAGALLAWTLGPGVVLLGLLLLGAGALWDGYITLRHLAIAVVVLAVTGLIVGLMLTVGLARSFSERIQALRAAVAGVQTGRLDRDVTVDDGSELGLLQAGFNRMLAGLRERERMRDLFGRQVGEDVVRHALEHGVELGGEAREAAVLFVDLQGSSRLAQERDPGEVVAILNAFFAVVVEVVDAHAGWVNKFEGDGALCVFGAPLADPDCAAHALRAGRELSARLRSEIPDVQAAIGVSAGRVVAGNVGAARRFEYTVIGDAVNEAARLSELAKQRPGGLLASGRALAKAPDDERARWCSDGELTLRGRTGPTETAMPREHVAVGD